MKTSLLIAAFLLGLLVGIGMSGRAEDRAVVSGLAIHIGQGRHCNEYITPGIGLEHDLSKNWQLAVGVYDNSNCKASAYVAGAWLPLRFADLRLGTISGLVSGYNNSIFPVAGLVASFQPKGKFGINLLFIPPAGETSKGVAWFQLSFPIAWLK